MTKEQYSENLEENIEAEAAKTKFPRPLLLLPNQLVVSSGHLPYLLQESNHFINFLQHVISNSFR
ncbi:hypothetical protein D0469_01235 [Peribacillus saganii]|uniref:Uncharacterized protein n=1 Tax=Peribacillus saganii TaxID=2303992 RepID=A0A372LUL4_9BACI|nr:hypothetical protein [Peribacillus saganii]RFU71490.1 hypothetical protein D0469_01235 [Peribacillus saganii]